MFWFSIVGVLVILEIAIFSISVFMCGFAILFVLSVFVLLSEVTTINTCVLVITMGRRVG